MSFFSKISFLSLIFLVYFSFFTSRAEAGILSFFEKILNMEKEDMIPSSSAATMPLLQSSASADHSANSNNPLNIVDQNSLLVVAGPLGTIADIENAPSTQISLYTVRKGDTLSNIAKMFNVDVNTIRWANDLKKGDILKAGQQLVILPITGVQYAVKKGDTLAGIAKKFGSDENEIVQFNDIDLSKPLETGLVIVVPNGELAEKAEPAGTTRPKMSYGYESAPSYIGYYMRPIKGGYKSQGIHGYNGVDLATSCREPIYASASGDVIIEKSSGWNGGYGKYIVISHPNGTQTLYSHNSENIVSKGWHVAQGQLIGYIGGTGKATGCHVHFEVRGAKNLF